MADENFRFYIFAFGKQKKTTRAWCIYKKKHFEFTDKNFKCHTLRKITCRAFYQDWRATANILKIYFRRLWLCNTN